MTVENAGATCTVTCDNEHDVRYVGIPSMNAVCKHLQSTQVRVAEMLPPYRQSHQVGTDSSVVLCTVRTSQARAALRSWRHTTDCASGVWVNTSGREVYPKSLPWLVAKRDRECGQTTESPCLSNERCMLSFTSDVTSDVTSDDVTCYRLQAMLQATMLHA